MIPARPAPTREEVYHRIVALIQKAGGVEFVSPTPTITDAMEAIDAYAAARAEEARVEERGKVTDSIVQTMKDDRVAWRKAGIEAGRRAGIEEAIASIREWEGPLPSRSSISFVLRERIRALLSPSQPERKP